MYTVMQTFLAVLRESIKIRKRCRICTKHNVAVGYLNAETADVCLTLRCVSLLITH